MNERKNRMRIKDSGFNGGGEKTKKLFPKNFPFHKFSIGQYIVVSMNESMNECFLMCVLLTYLLDLIWLIWFSFCLASF